MTHGRPFFDMKILEKVKIGKSKVGLGVSNERIGRLAWFEVESRNGQDLRTWLVILDSWKTIFWYEKLSSTKTTWWNRVKTFIGIM